MCGIAGIVNLREAAPPSESVLRRMLGMIRHRGPDEFGLFLDSSVALGNARLSIIDLAGGQQPISNEDGNLWIVFNGEVFNYLELRSELEARGHRFATHSDTEVVLHLYEELGPKCLERLNGQFALAIWEVRERSLLLARDRLGIRPLYYALTRDALIFGSEIKAILIDPRVRRELDHVALDQVFSFWCPLSPRTAFRDIAELPPAHYLVVRQGEVAVRRYWQLDFTPAPAPGSSIPGDRPIEELLEEFRSLLLDATQIRLRADVPVGAYLSGGIDSSTIAYIIRHFSGSRLDTFSIAFTDDNFDESLYQKRMAAFLGTDHQVVEATHADIGRVFPEVIWHAEVPLMRTAPAPMFLLSRLVRDQRFKVVLTGEGADEFLAGYDIFKEAKIRRFWARSPDSGLRPLLFRKLYPDIANLSRNNPAFLAAFFREGLTEIDSPYYSHLVRWRNNRRTHRFFRREVAQDLPGPASHLDALVWPTGRNQWEPLARAQFIEITVFLSQYLLSAQGDRVAMAHSVEGRHPFLDFRLVEFCNRLPARVKLRGLAEKYLLKCLGRGWLPDEIWRRTKRPYRAPIHRSFFNPDAPPYVRELLTSEQVRSVGLFQPEAVSQLVHKLERGAPVGETDDMALAGILSTQLLHQQFIASFRTSSPLTAADNVKVCRGCAAKPPVSAPSAGTPA